MVAAKPGECAKCYWIVHFSVVSFMPCEFHFKMEWSQSTSSSCQIDKELGSVFIIE